MVAMPRVGWMSPPSTPYGQSTIRFGAIPAIEAVVDLRLANVRHRRSDHLSGIAGDRARRGQRHPEGALQDAGRAKSRTPKVSFVGDQRPDRHRHDLHLRPRSLLIAPHG